jgi:hypothetical protein
MKFSIYNPNSGNSKIYETEDPNEIQGIKNNAMEGKYVVVDLDSGKVLNEPIAAPMSKGESFIAGMTEGGTFGAGDQLDRRQQSQQENPWPHFGGYVAGNLASTASLGAAAGLAGRAAVSGVSNLNALRVIPTALASTGSAVEGFVGSAFDPTKSKSDVVAETVMSAAVPPIASKGVGLIKGGVSKLLKSGDSNLDEFNKIKTDIGEHSTSGKTKLEENKLKTTELLRKEQQSAVAPYLDVLNQKEDMYKTMLNQKNDLMSQGQKIWEQGNKAALDEAARNTQFQRMVESDTAKRAAAEAKKQQVILEHELDKLKKQYSYAKTTQGKADIVARIDAKKAQIAEQIKNQNLPPPSRTPVNPALPPMTTLDNMDELRRLQSVQLEKAQAMAEAGKTPDVSYLDKTYKEKGDVLQNNLQDVTGVDLFGRAMQEGVAAAPAKAAMSNWLTKDPTAPANVNIGDSSSDEYLKTLGLQKDDINNIRDLVMQNKSRPDITDIKAMAPSALSVDAKRQVVAGRMRDIIDHLKIFPNDTKAQQDLDYLKQAFAVTIQ